jgi:hypothetical protein
MTGILVESIKKFQLKYSKTLDKYALWNLEGTLILLDGRTKWLNNILNELKTN